MKFINLQEFIKVLNTEQESPVLIYLENKGRRVNKFQKYNYKVMTAFNVSVTKDSNGKESAKIGKEIQIEDKLLLTLRDSKNDSQFIKILVMPQKQIFNDHDFYNYNFKLVSDEEIIRLKLTKKLDEFIKIDDTLDVNF